MSTSGQDKLKNQLNDIASFHRYKEPQRGRHGSRVTKFPSRKNHRSVTCDSLLEAAFCLELEYRTDVLRYQAHPYVICFKESSYQYTPDFLVEFSSGDFHLVEVKNDYSYFDKAISARIAIYSEILASQGCYLEYISMSHFYMKTRINNLQLLYHRAFWSEGRASGSIKNMIGERTAGKTTLLSLIESRFKIEDIAHAIFYQQIFTNLNRPLTINTIVRI